MMLRRRHEIRSGNYTALGVQRLRMLNWRWRVWRVSDGQLVNSGVSATRQQALNAAESWRRLDARQYGRDPSDV